MARQAGAVMIEGTVGGLTFYRRDGNFYVRLKSSLSGERWKKDAAFARSRECAVEFGGGSTVASAVWRLLRPLPELKQQLGRGGYNRLAAAFRKVILAGDGQRGARAFRAHLVAKVCGEIALGNGFVVRLRDDRLDKSSAIFDIVSAQGEVMVAFRLCDFLLRDGKYRGDSAVVIVEDELIAVERELEDDSLEFGEGVRGGGCDAVIEEAQRAVFEGRWPGGDSGSQEYFESNFMVFWMTKLSGYFSRRQFW